MQQGLQKGRQEMKVEAAQKLLAAGMPREEIARLLEIGTDEF
ncbi:MAG: hypothetical protein RDV48_19910 [Candidatus Eremiobacteraeota bacterium]|nr:hypothetical protein [Candidatus Eremiobacteraeota bacterium]